MKRHVVKNKKALVSGKPGNISVTPDEMGGRLPRKWCSKTAGQQSAALPMATLFIVQFPFLGAFKELFFRNFAVENLITGAVGLTIGGVLAWCVRKYGKIAFGYDEQGVFYSGVFKKKTISWPEIKRIVVVQEIREWNAIDAFDEHQWSDEDRLTTLIISQDQKLSVPRWYTECAFFARAVSEIAGVKIERQERDGRWFRYAG